MVCERKEKFKFYNRLTKDEKKSLIIERYSDGEEIECLNTKTMNFFYYVIEGKVKINGYLGEKQINCFFEPMEGSLIGSMLFYGNLDLDLDLISNSKKLIMIKIPIKIIERLKRNDLEFNSYLYEQTLESFWFYKGKSETEKMHGIKGVIAYALLENYDSKYIYIENQSKFSEDLNISDDSFYNVINKLLIEKIIEKEGNSIKILKEWKLKDLYFNFIDATV